MEFPVQVALAELVPVLPATPGWWYEIKLWTGFESVRCP